MIKIISEDAPLVTKKKRVSLGIFGKPLQNSIQNSQQYPTEQTNLTSTLTSPNEIPKKRLFKDETTHQQTTVPITRSLEQQQQQNPIKQFESQHSIQVSSKFQHSTFELARKSQQINMARLDLPKIASSQQFIQKSAFLYPIIIQSSDLSRITIQATSPQLLPNSHQSTLNFNPSEYGIQKLDKTGLTSPQSNYNPTQLLNSPKQPIPAAQFSRKEISMKSLKLRSPIPSKEPNHHLQESIQSSIGLPTSQEEEDQYSLSNLASPKTKSDNLVEVQKYLKPSQLLHEIPEKRIIPVGIFSSANKELNNLSEMPNTKSTIDSATMKILTITSMDFTQKLQNNIIRKPSFQVRDRQQVQLVRQNNSKHEGNSEHQKTLAMNNEQPSKEYLSPHMKKIQEQPLKENTDPTEAKKLIPNKLIKSKSVAPLGKSSSKQGKKNQKTFQLGQQVQQQNQIEKWKKQILLPNNFIIYECKGFSKFTYKLTDELMRKHIFCFLTINECLKLRLMNKCLSGRVSKYLRQMSLMESILLQKKQLKITYCKQINDLVGKEIVELRQIADQFPEISSKEVQRVLTMVIPSKELIVVLHLFSLLFAKHLLCVKVNLLVNKNNWKNVINSCFNGESNNNARLFLAKHKGQMDLSFLEMIVQEHVYKEARKVILDYESILDQLNISNNPFIFKVYSFVEKLLDLSEILLLKYPNSVKYVQILAEIQQNPKLRSLQYIDDHFSLGN